jgi:hypothetical protein
MTDPQWRTSGSQNRGSSYDARLAYNRSRGGLGNIIRYGSPFFLFMYLEVMGASFIFAGCSSAILLGVVYIPLVARFVHLEKIATFFALVWAALCITAYVHTTPNAWDAGWHEVATVWMNSLRLVHAALHIFQPLSHAPAAASNAT